LMVGINPRHSASICVMTTCFRKQRVRKHRHVIVIVAAASKGVDSHPVVEGVGTQ